MTSEIRTNSLKSRAGLSTVTMTDSGPMFSGITTFVDNSGFTFGVGGGTSIFTPATNVLTFGTNNTEKVRIDANGNANISGVTTAANFKTGVSNLHDVGLTLSGGQLDVGSNIKLGNAGVVTATSFVGSGANLTGISADVVDDTSPQLGGDLASNSHDILFADNDKAIFGTGSDFKIYHNGTHNYLMASNGDYVFDTGSAEKLRITSAGHVILQGGIIYGEDNASNVLKLQSTSGNNNHSRIEIGASQSSDNGGIHFYTAGSSVATRHMTLKGTDGNLGIGVDNPTVKLHASKSYSAPTGGFDSNIVAAFTNSGGGSYAGLAIQGGSGAGSFIHFGDTDDSNIGIINYEHSDNSFRFTVNTDQRLKITHADATLYGTTDGVLNITTTDGRGSFIRFQESGTTKVWVGSGQGMGLGAATDLGLRATNDIRMRTGTEEHAVLTAEGYFAAKGLAGSWVSSNTHPASSQFHQFTQTGSGKRIVVFRNEHHAGLGVNIEMSSTGNAESLYCTGNGSTRFRVLNNGNVGSASNSYGGISDIKLKENIVDANSQWNDIKAIKVRNFNFKDTPDTKMLGVVAQEIETISPGLISELVDRDPNTNEPLETTTKEVKYSILYMKAIKCLQEAQARIEKIEEDNITLRARVTNLEGN